MENKLIRLQSDVMVLVVIGFLAAEIKLGGYGFLSEELES